MDMTAIIETETQRRASHTPVRGRKQGSFFPGTRPKGRNRTIFVLDDEFLIAMQMAQLMENFGWSILGPAGSLEEADVLLEENDSPDAAILDINIRGASVFELAETLHDRGVPILFCSGYEVIEETDRFTGCAKLRKPFGGGQIFSEIEALMKRKEAGCA